MTMACAGDSIIWLNSEGQLVHWAGTMPRIPLASPTAPPWNSNIAAAIAGVNAEGNRKERRAQLARERRKQ